MKIISSRVHGVLDYVVGALLIAAPWMMNMTGAAFYVPVILGAGTLLYSLFTDYELGLARMIPFRSHLALDAVSGIFLASSPWIFGFSDVMWVPHVAAGLMELLVVASTNPHTHATPPHRHRA